MTPQNTTTPLTKSSPVAVRSIVPHLTFNNQAEEAISLYVSTFKNSRIVSLQRFPANPAGMTGIMHAEVELNGMRITVMDGGPSFTFSQGFSLVATCDTQAELDAVWARLTDGGEEGPCGWLTDKFGVAWQIVPTALGEMMSHPERGNTQKVMEAFMPMKKLDIATLQKAYAQR